MSQKLMRMMMQAMPMIAAVAMIAGAACVEFGVIRL